MTEDRRKAAETLHVRRLNAFIRRARRVKAHSLMTDRALLLKLAQGQLRITVNSATDEVQMIQELPPEEQIESAAARLRPIILNGDDTYYASALAALKYFAASTRKRAVLDAIKRLQKHWAQFDSNSTKARGYEASITNSEGTVAPPTSDSELAWAYFYGDVVHHDGQRLEATKEFGVRERYRSAVSLVARLMIATVQTLGFIEMMQEAGLLPVDEEAFTSDVVITDTVFRQKVTVYIADPGANALVPGEPLGDEWQQVTDETMREIYRSMGGTPPGE